MKRYTFITELREGKGAGPQIDVEAISCQRAWHAAARKLLRLDLAEYRVLGMRWR